MCSCGATLNYGLFLVVQKALAKSLVDMADTVAELAATASKEMLVSTVASLLETSGNILEVGQQTMSPIFPYTNTRKVLLLMCLPK